MRKTPEGHRRTPAHRDKQLEKADTRSAPHKYKQLIHDNSLRNCREMSPVEYMTYLLHRRSAKRGAAKPPSAVKPPKTSQNPLLQELSPTPDKRIKKNSGRPPRSPLPLSPLSNPRQLAVYEVPELEALLAKFPQQDISDYCLGPQLGAGAFSTVKSASHRLSGIEYALKTYSKAKIAEPKRKQSVTQEISILTRLSHRNVIRLFNVIDGPSELHLAMEYVGGCSLHSFLKRRPNRRLPECQTRRIYREILEGVAYCHASNVAHRDIKLENIIIDEQEHVKIIDFGFATCMQKYKRTRLFCGTLSYMAPEIVLRKDYEGPPVDVWALGVLLYVLLCGHFPFRGMNDKDLYTKITRGNFIIDEHVSPRAKLLINNMMRVNPDDRLTVKQALMQCWLSEEAEGTEERELHEAVKLNACSVNGDLIDVVVLLKNSGLRGSELSRNSGGGRCREFRDYYSGFS